MKASERYDSLFMWYAENDRDRTKKSIAFIPRPVPLDWKLLKVQGIAESGLDPDAVSRVGASGLMQFMAATWAEYVKNDWGPVGPPPNRHVSIFDPEDNINAAADMMAWLLGVFGGDKRKALASYNYGIGNVKKTLAKHGDAWEDHLPNETRDYLLKILGS